MKDYQTQFVKILEKKGVKHESINRWKMGTNSPKLTKVEELCEDNEIELFFFDGNLFALLEFTQMKCAELGHSMNYQLNKL